MSKPDQSFWVKDDYVLNCTSCSILFTVTQRRHHCRSCGEVFCSNCTTKSILLTHLNYPKHLKQRVCEVCFTANTVTKEEETYSKEKLLQKETLEGLKRIYRRAIKPLEIQFKFGNFSSPTLTDADFDSKPMVLLIGQYSVGKTSFIRFLLGRDYPGQRVGPEPTTDQFVIVSGTKQNDTVIPGNALTVQTDRPFNTLKKFGSVFLNKLQCSETDTRTSATILEQLTFVDTPGVLSGEKQRIGRSYDYTAVIEWFASRSDRILLLFDAHKLDISDEFQNVIESLKGYDEKIRVILNKADMIGSQELMKVHGALLWSLGKVIKTPECVRVYVGSFWDKPSRNVELYNLFQKESNDLIKDLKALPYSAVIRKINEVVKRARAAKTHALLITHLKGKLPFFGKEQALEKMLINLDDIYGEVSRKYNLPLPDFPDKASFKKALMKTCNNDLSLFPSLNVGLVTGIEDILSSAIPRLSATHSKKMMEHGFTEQEINPFSTQTTQLQTSLVQFSLKNGNGNENDDELWSLNKEEFSQYAKEFDELKPIEGKLSGTELREVLSSSGLSRKDLKQVWNLADIDGDGSLDVLEFALAKHLIYEAQITEDEIKVPEKLPFSLVPPNKRHLVKN